jgi:predicted permease
MASIYIFAPKLVVSTIYTLTQSKKSGHLHLICAFLGYILPSVSMEGIVYVRFSC